LSVLKRIPNSTEARDVLFHLHSQTNPTLHAEIGPLVMTRGEGVHVYGADGKRYLEAMAGLWCTSLGFSDKRLKAAAIIKPHEVDEMLHLFAQTLKTVEARLSPSGLSH
jgi:4-aminobutyrate--pyruvate transaminase